MSSIGLLMAILGAVAAQVAAFMAYSFWRHWQAYQALKSGVGLPDGMPGPGAPPQAKPALVPGWPGYRAMRVTQKVLEDQAGQICSFYLAPESGDALPDFKPGQFLTFKLDIPRAEADGTDAVVRCYSLSAAPGDAQHYRVSIKRVPAPSGSAVAPGRSSNFFHDQVRVGDLLQVKAPSGHFYLTEGTGPIVLIGGGIGITPMLSMLSWSLQRQPDREVWLYYGVRHGGEVMQRGTLEALAAQYPSLRLRLCFSDPLPTEVPGRHFHHHGRVSVTLMRTELSLKPYHFYICGPTPMMEGLVHGLEDWGVPPDRIHFEAFGPASIRRQVALPSVIEADTTDQAVSHTITFARSQQSCVWTPATGSLLELAEAHGIAVESGCRAGSCGACQTTIVAGEVAYAQAPDHDPEPGTCLMCLCTPKTDVTLEA